MHRPGTPFWKQRFDSSAANSNENAARVATESRDYFNGGPQPSETRSVNSRSDFIAFLMRIDDGTMSVDDWNRFALGRYEDAEVEAARKRLVRQSLSCSQCSGHPIPAGIESLVRDLIAELTT
jgi:hypothetical protein